MKEPCASCPRREQDFGGCRCQAFALTGDARATDPVCHLAPDHARVAELAAVRSGAPYVYRRMEQPGGKQRPVVRSREGQTVS
jgi:pyrroloquinoline quinone biosynthesis protein E